MTPFWKRRPRYTFPVQRIRAIRAMIEGNGGPERIDLEMEIDGDRAVVELTPDQVRELIQGLIAAHEAIRPTIRFPRNW